VRVIVYVEGGGDTAALRARCREGFRKLLEKAGFSDRMPRIVASGSRAGTFDDFRTAHRARGEDDYPILLVDSEERVNDEPWEHLEARDGWKRPENAEDEQAQLMVVCMETRILADREALRRAFRPGLRENALPGEKDLERRSKEDVQAGLAKATAGCQRDRRYEKGRRSFQLLAELDPNTLAKHLPHFARLRGTLDQKL
jgi:hypothetical protein